MAIAGLFVLRAAAGAEAVDVRISPWLLLCTALLALFLALAKRRGGLVLAGRSATPGRAVLQGYSLPLVDQLVAVVTSATIVAYSLYTFGSEHSQALMLTIPFVVFGLFRYLLLIHRDDLGEEPEQILLTDRPILAAVALWAVSAAVILAVSLSCGALRCGRRSRLCSRRAVPRGERGARRRLPAGRDQVHEQRQIVETGVALGEVVAFDSFEAPDRLAGEPAHLGDLATDGHRFLRQALANGFADLTGGGGLDLRGEIGKRLDLLPRALERRLDVARVDAAFRSRRQTLLRALDRTLVHERKITWSPDG